MQFRFIFFIGILLVGCHGSKNDFSVRYEFTGISSLSHLDNTGEHPVVVTADSIAEEAYMLRVNLSSVILEEGRAFADYDHPAEDKNPIDSIRITSNANFDLEHPSGSSLNDKFMHFNGSYFYVQSLENLSVTNYYKADYKENPVPDKIDLILMNPPTLNNFHVFTVQLFLRNGAQFVASSSPILLF